MATGATGQAKTGDQDTDGVLSGYKWNGTKITYTFPTSASYYPSNYGGATNEPSGFQTVSPSFETMVRSAFEQYENVSNLTFSEVSASTHANISIARTSSLGSFNGTGYYPGSASPAGDVWFSSDPSRVGDEEVLGRGTWRIVMHEIGHALGLKHGQEKGGPADTAMTAAHDYNDYSIMSYLRTKGGSPNGATPDRYGNPQSLMMYDIAAVQAMYGANFKTQSGNTVYAWDPNSARETINGVAQTSSPENKIFMTLWDGGGVDTYDLSKYTTSVAVDLRPGMASTFSDAQRAITDIAKGAKAGGNVFNALQYNGDARSLIENAKGGSGADTITGNDANNLLDGGKGVDVLTGGKGDDRYVVDNVSDKVVESAGSAYGVDTVMSAVTIKALAANVENVVLTGSAALSATGNGLANAMTGNAGANVLDGKLGSDALTGGAGKDTFFFSTKPATSNLDHVKDFRAVDDTIRLENAIFTALTKTGTLDGDAFATITAQSAVVSADAHVLYDKAHGTLYYDPNGGSSSGRVAFAVLDNHASLTFQDFVVA